MDIARHIINPHHLSEIKETHAVGDYFTIDPDGRGIVLHDVVTLEPLEGTETPPGVLEDADLRYGLDFLQAQGRKKNLCVNLVLAPHGSADDFARILAGHEHILDASPVVALEMTSLCHEPQLSDHPGRAEFQQAELSWCRSMGKVILPCEIALDDNSALAASLTHIWNNVYEPTLQDQTLSPETKTTAAFIAEAVYQRSRQPAILARMGYLLSEFADRQILSEKLTIPLVLGSWHENDKHRLDNLAVPNKVFKTAGTSSNQKAALNAFGEVIMRMTYTSHATLDDLSVIPPYYS